MKKLLYLTVVITIIISLYSCGKCKILGEFFLLELKNEIPYKGYETQYFKHNYDTLKLKAGSRSNNIYEESHSNSTCDYYLVEVNTINIRNDEYSIDMGMHTDSYFHPTELGIVVKKDNNKKGVGVVFGNLPLSKDNLEAGVSFYDSIVFTENKYFDVFGKSFNIWEGAISPYPIYCYYSTELGIVRINFSDNTNWELASIDW